MAWGGAYPADRAAALSGVPKSTIRYWARQAYIVPSVSPYKVMLWSYVDLMGLRVVDWLRTEGKRTPEGLEISRTKMRDVKRALDKLRSLDLDLFEEGRPTIAVTRRGEILINPKPAPVELVNQDGQVVHRDLIDDIIAPYVSKAGHRAPDLQMPRSELRIFPRRLGGAPHVVSTRIETQSLYALSSRGFNMDQLLAFYPVLTREQVSQAIELESQLQHNLRKAA